MLDYVLKTINKIHAEYGLKEIVKKKTELSEEDLKKAVSYFKAGAGFSDYNLFYKLVEHISEKKFESEELSKNRDNLIKLIVENIPENNTVFNYKENGFEKDYQKTALHVVSNEKIASILINAGENPFFISNKMESLGIDMSFNSNIIVKNAYAEMILSNKDYQELKKNLFNKDYVLSDIQKQLINLHDENGDTLLNLSIKANDNEIMKKLIESGANPNLRDKDNKTALDLTDRNLLVDDTRQFLIENGAEITDKNKFQGQGLSAFIVRMTEKAMSIMHSFKENIVEYKDFDAFKNKTKIEDLDLMKKEYSEKEVLVLEQKEEFKVDKMFSVEDLTDKLKNLKQEEKELLEMANTQNSSFKNK